MLARMLSPCFGRRSVALYAATTIPKKVSNGVTDSDLPPALLVTCGFDMLRDVGHAYAQKLASADNDLTSIHFPTCRMASSR